MRDKFSIWLRRSPMWVCISTLLIASYIVAMPVILWMPSGSEIGTLDKVSNVITDIISVVIIAPAAETAMNQTLPIYLQRKYTKLGWICIILISALIFGAIHFYSIRYIAFAFLVGTVLSYGYVVRRRKNGSPFIIITLVHAIRNAIALVVHHAT